MRLYRIAWRYTENGVECVNTLHVATSTDVPTWIGGSAPDPEALATELNTRYTTKFRAMLTNSATLHDLTVQDELDPLNPSEAREGFVKSIELAGTRVESNRDQPNMLCAVATLQTGKIGRSFRGRMFLPPVVSESAVSTGTFTTAGDYWLACIAFLKEIAPTFGGGSAFSSLWLDTWHAKHVVYSRTRRAHGDDEWANDIVSYRLNKTPHWLRSREH